MKELLKKAIVTRASFMVMSLGVTADCLSLENPAREFRKEVDLTSQMYLNTKFFDHVT
ncbi:MAG: hypothetical protein JRF56_23540, partial [Deltaproteobacteria bacterium]|nr:hypothetical protein [Deltaproteobacteria bacterium]